MVSTVSFESLLRAQLRRTRVVGFFVGLLVLGLGLAMTFFAPKDPTMTTPMIYLSIAFGILFLGTSVLLFRAAFRSDVLTEALNNAPHTIVWIYVQQVVTQHGKATHAANVIVCFNNGKKFPIMTTPANAQALVEGFKVRLPHARFEFSKELEASYHKDPTSLVRL